MDASDIKDLGIVIGALVGGMANVGLVVIGLAWLAEHVLG